MSVWQTSRVETLGPMIAESARPGGKASSQEHSLSDVSDIYAESQPEVVWRDGTLMRGGTATPKDVLLSDVSDIYAESYPEVVWTDGNLMRGGTASSLGTPAGNSGATVTALNPFDP